MNSYYLLIGAYVFSSLIASIQVREAYLLSAASKFWLILLCWLIPLIGPVIAMVKSKSSFKNQSGISIGGSLNEHGNNESNGSAGDGGGSGD